MDKLIEQAIKNCKINKYEKYFEQVCREYKRLLDAESEQLNIADVSGMLPHIHQAGDGKDIDTCKLCGKDIRSH